MKEFYKGFKGATYGPASSVRHLSDEENLKVQLRLKAEGRIDKVGFPAFTVNATPRKKKWKNNYNPHYYRHDYQSDYYYYRKKQAGL